MARITTTVLIILVLLNGTVTVMEGSGLTDDMGVQLAPGISSTMDDVVENARTGFSPNTGVVESLITLFVAALKTFQVLIQGIYAAPTMFLNLGFPAWLVFPVFAPMYIVAVFNAIYMATGRRAMG